MKKTIIILGLTYCTSLNLVSQSNAQTNIGTIAEPSACDGAVVNGDAILTPNTSNSSFEVNSAINLQVVNYVNNASSCFVPQKVRWLLFSRANTPNGNPNYNYTSIDGSLSNGLIIDKIIGSGGEWDLSVIPGEVSNSPLSISVQILGTYYNSNGSTTTRTQYINNGIYTIPVNIINTPTITGTSALTQYCATAQTYTATDFGSGNQFAWTYPAGWSIAAGYNINSNPIVLIPNCTGGGNVSVTVKRSQAPVTYFKTASLAITRPLPTLTRNGTWQTDGFCTGATPSFSINPVCGASSYTWTMPAGWSQTNANGGLSANTSIGSVAGIGNIIVTANFAGCNAIITSTTELKANQVPAAVTMLPGVLNYCSNNVTCRSNDKILYNLSAAGNIPTGITGLTFTTSGSTKFASNNSQTINVPPSINYLPELPVYTGTQPSYAKNGTIRMKVKNCAGSSLFSNAVDLYFYLGTRDPNCICRTTAPICTPPCPLRIGTSNVTSNISSEAITLGNEDKIILTIEIKDIYNNIISSYTANDENINLNTDNLKPGIYYVIIKNKEELISVQKIAKEKK
jgi:hypothetical protein